MLQYKHLTVLIPFLVVNALIVWLGCASLPEPDSPDARLYVRYCSGSGCHDPILPQAGGRRYWDLQVQRMLNVMRENGSPVPTAQQRERIIAYLHKHAQGTDRH